MKTPRPTCALLPAFVAAIFLHLPSARADFDAVTNKVNEGVGFVNGAVFFTFTASTNLAVSRVGYWNSGAMVYSNVSLTLLAGQRYSISVQDGPLSAPGTVLFQYYTNGQFQPGPFLTSPVSSLFTVTTGFANVVTNYFFLGPNFSYQILTGSIAQPLLNIAAGNLSNAVLS